MRKVLVLASAVLIVLMSYPSLAQSPMPTRDELQDGWNPIAPAGDTICSRGTPYEFFVRPADSEKVLIHFQGGGACWDETSCSVAGATFSDSINPPRNAGIFDADNPDNPVADYNIIQVSYCTGDIHTGDETVVYNDELTIEHQGATNANAVIDWMFENYPDPEDVIITGCSAGAYGAIYHSYRIMSEYDDITISVVGDSGVGIASPDWLGLELWGTYDNVPTELQNIPGLDRPESFTTQYYIEAARAFPDNFFSQYTTERDEVQTGFFFFQGGIGWTGQMYGALDQLNEEVPNFASFVAGGTGHCILPTPVFYDWGADGVAFDDWFGDIVANDTADSVACEDCEEVERFDE